MYDYTDQHHVLPSGVSSQHTETLFINTSEINPTAANMLMSLDGTDPSFTTVVCASYDLQRGEILKKKTERIIVI